VNVLQVLEQGSWFRARSEELKQALLSALSVRALPKGSFLFRRGDSDSGLYAVLSGSVRISGIDMHGNESILTFVEAPEWIGELALFDGSSRTHDAVCAVDTQVAYIPKSSLENMLRESPVFWKDFGCLLSHKLRLSFRVMEDAALLPAPKRLAKRLLIMAQSHGYSNQEEDGSSITLRIDQASLGNMLNLSRQSTNQILRELELSGVVSLSYGAIEIRNIDLLREFSC